MNWIRERWLPIVVEFKGSVKNDRLPRKYNMDHSIKNSIPGIDKTQAITKLTTDVSGQDFIKYGKINLKFD